MIPRDRTTVPVKKKNIISFHAIMHKTIVQNKIIALFALFFCPANIYRTSLQKVRLGRPNPHPTTTARFLSQKKKKTFYSELYAP